MLHHCWQYYAVLCVFYVAPLLAVLAVLCVFYVAPLLVVLAVLCSHNVILHYTLYVFYITKCFQANLLQLYGVDHISKLKNSTLIIN